MTAATQTAVEPDYEYEIVNGIPEAKKMASLKHGGTIMRLGARLQIHVEAKEIFGKKPMASSAPTEQIVG